MGFFADVGKGAVAIVVVENVLAIVGDVEILESVVIVVAHADTLAPSSVGQAGFGGDVGERAIVVVAIEVARRGFAGRQLFQCCAVDDKYVRPAVIVIIEDGDAGPGSLDDVFLLVFAAEDDRCCKTGLLCDVGKMRDRLCAGGLWIDSAYARSVCG